MAASLLEVFVRGLVIRWCEEALEDPELKFFDVESRLEAQRRLGFKQLVTHLVDAGLFSSADADEAVNLYEEVRIPVHHGLAARLTGADKTIFETSLQWAVRGSSSVQARDLETFVEREAVALVERIVGVLERNSLFFLGSTT